MSARTRLALAAASASALLVLTGCSTFDPGAAATKAPPATEGAPGGPSKDGESPDSGAPATEVSGTDATSVSELDGMNCANVLVDPEPHLVQSTSNSIRVLKSQWTVEGGDYKIVPPSSQTLSSGGSKSDFGEHEFPIDGGIRCRIRDDRPSGDHGTVYEYVRFDPKEREGILGFLRGNSFEELDLGDGVIAISARHDNGPMGEPAYYETTWYIGDDWLASGFYWPTEDGSGGSPFTGDLTEKTPADYLPPELQAPMCGTFFGTFKADELALPIGEFFTGFDSMDPNGQDPSKLIDEFPAEQGAQNGCIGIEWTEADQATIDGAVADLGEPVASTDHSNLYSDGAGGFVITFTEGGGYATTTAPQELAEQIRAPNLTFRPYGEE